MGGFLGRVHAFRAQDDGVTATEYALLLALLVCVVAVALRALGTDVGGLFNGLVFGGGAPEEPYAATLEREAADR